MYGYVRESFWIWILSDVIPPEIAGVIYYLALGDNNQGSHFQYPHSMDPNKCHVRGNWPASIHLQADIKKDVISETRNVITTRCSDVLLKYHGCILCVVSCV